MRFQALDPNFFGSALSLPSRGVSALEGQPLLLLLLLLSSRARGGKKNLRRINISFKLLLSFFVLFVESLSLDLKKKKRGVGEGKNSLSRFLFKSNFILSKKKKKIITLKRECIENFYYILKSMMKYFNSAVLLISGKSKQFTIRIIIFISCQST